MSNEVSRLKWCGPNNIELKEEQRRSKQTLQDYHWKEALQWDTGIGFMNLHQIRPLEDIGIDYYLRN